MGKKQVAFTSLGENLLACWQKILWAQDRNEMEYMELVKLKNMKASMYKQSTSSGAHLRLEVAEWNMGEGHTWKPTKFGIFSQKNSEIKPNQPEILQSQLCGSEELKIILKRHYQFRVIFKGFPVKNVQLVFVLCRGLFPPSPQQ